MGGAAAAAGGRRVVGAPSQQPAAQMSGADESWLAGGSNWCELLLVLLVGHRTRLRLDQEGFLLRGQQQEEVCGNAMAFQKKKIQDASSSAVCCARVLIPSFSFLSTVTFVNFFFVRDDKIKRVFKDDFEVLGEMSLFDGHRFLRVVIWLTNQFKSMCMVYQQSTDKIDLSYIKKVSDP